MTWGGDKDEDSGLRFAFYYSPSSNDLQSMYDLNSKRESPSEPRKEVLFS